MTTEERDQVKAKIEAKIAEVENDIVDLKEATKPISPENSIGRLSRMDAINNKSVSEAALRSAQERVIGLRSARERVELEDFGKCTKCGNEIQLQRIMFMPESTRCMVCVRKR